MTFKRYNTPVRSKPQALTIDEATGAAILTVTMRRKGPRQGETYRLLVDVEDFPMVSTLTWTPMVQKARARCCDGRSNNNKDHVYFVTSVRQSDGNYKGVSMQRLVMGNPFGELVGFRDHNYLDLRKTQLYVGSQKQVNERMRKTVKPTISQYKGVSFKAYYSGKFGRHIAQASNGGKQPIRIGTFPPTPQGEIAAARAYDCFVLANFTNPNPNFRASSYSVEEITAYKLDSDGKRISPSVLSVMPSATTRRTGLVPGLQPSHVSAGTSKTSDAVPVSTTRSTLWPVIVGNKPKPKPIPMRKPVASSTWMRKGRSWRVPAIA